MAIDADLREYIDIRFDRLSTLIANVHADVTGIHSDVKHNDDCIHRLEDRLDANSTIRREYEGRISKLEATIASLKWTVMAVAALGAAAAAIVPMIHPAV